MHKDKQGGKEDNTVCLNGRLYQIEEPVGATHVEMQERLDGRLMIKVDGRALKYTEIQPAPKPRRKRTESRARRAAVPKPTHPWRQGLKLQRLRQANAY